MDASATQALQLAVTATGGDIAALALVYMKRRSRVDSERDHVLRRIHGIGWPRLRGLLAATFSQLGYDVEEIDDDPRQVIDLILSDDRGYTYVHCKGWDQPEVTAEDIHRLRMAMKVLAIQRGMWVSTGRFTDFAQRLAGQAGITLIDHVKLEHLLGWSRVSPN